MPQAVADPVADLLKRTPVPDAVRAQAWDAYEQATSEDDLAQRLQTIKLPDTAKAALWDIKYKAAFNADAVPPSDEALTAPAPHKGTLQKFLDTASPGVYDMAAGVGKGVLSSAVKVGRMVAPRGFGADRFLQSQQVEALIAPPENFPGKVGFYGEQLAEYVAPGAAMARGVAKAPMLVRMAAEGATAGGVGAVQSGGDPTMTTLAALGGAAGPPIGAAVKGGIEVVKRAAAGAKEGGVGGAIAAGVRTAAPEQPRTMLVQALKPRSTKVKFESSLDLAMPELKQAEQAIGKPIASVDDLLDATKAAKQAIQERLGILRGGVQGFHVDLSPVADAMVTSIPKKLQLENPEAALRLKAAANAYRGSFSLDDAETLLRETNAELEAFYGKYPRGQYAALVSNPEAASLHAQGKALRSAIYERLDEPGGGAAARELQRRYGSLLDVEGEAYRRANVAKRQQPESLSEQIGAVRAAADMARGTWRLLHGDISGAADIAAARAGRSAATAIKEQQTSDALIRRAFAQFKGRPSVVPMPSHRPIAGALPPGARQTGPAPDTSFVRGVPAMPVQSTRSALPPGQPRGRVFEMPGEVQPDPSQVGSVPAQPIAYEVDPHITVKAGGFRVAQFAGDPEAAKVAVASPAVREMLVRMLDDLDTFEPQRGGLMSMRDLRAGDPFINRPNIGGGAHYVEPTPGSPVGDDIRVISEQNVGNQEIKRAIQQLLQGKTPTNRLHTAALDAAMGYLEKRSGYRGPSVPARVEDEGFERFSRSIDEFFEQ